MAGFDPNQPRDNEGQWTEAEISARKAAGLSILDKPLKKNKNNLWMFHKSSPDKDPGKRWDQPLITYKELAQICARNDSLRISEVVKSKVGSQGEMSLFGNGASEMEYWVQLSQNRGWKNLIKVEEEVYRYYEQLSTGMQTKG